MNKHANFGFSSILLAFVMICILTFSALALITANSDYQLSKKVEHNNTAYYAAEREAYLMLAQIDSLLAISYQNATNESAYFEEIANTVTTLSDYRLVESDGSYFILFSIPIQENQDLEIKLALSYPKGNESSFYRIKEWKSVHETTYVEDQPLNLIGIAE